MILLSPFLLALLWIMPAYVSGISKVTLRSLMIIAAGMVVLILPLSPFSPPTTRRPSAGIRQKRALGIYRFLGYIFDTNYIMESGELGRFTTIFFWLKHNELFGPGGMLFGYGLNATNSGSTVSPGYIGAWYHLILDSTALSMMLWEVGIIGVILFIAMIASILIGMRPKETFSATILNMKIYSCSAPRLRFTSLPSAVYSAFLQSDPDDHSHATVLLWLALGALIVIHRSVRLNSGTQYE